MKPAPTVSLPTHAGILRLAGPIILANASVPLLGLADTAVIGNVGERVELGALALGVLVFHFLYWGFGFLRMGTTGFTAQADGTGDEAEVRAALGRALVIGAGIGTVLVVLQVPIVRGALALLSASPEVEDATATYLRIRIWGAPATLTTFAVMGTFLGLGRTTHVLALQLFLNGLNVALDVTFAGVLGWGVAGIAFGTVVAEWLALGFGMAIVLPLLRRRRRERDESSEPFLSWQRIRDPKRLRRTLDANADILVRTLCLLFGFAWFTNRGAAFGDEVLAANHVLLQFLAFSAFFLDGFAHAVEPLVGRAIATRRVDLFDAAVRRSTVLAGATAALLALAIAAFGGSLVALLTDLPEVRAVADAHLGWAALYVLASFVAFQLDGVFIGATRTRDMRNASAVAVAAFLVAEAWLTPFAGNDGLWLAFVVYVVARAATLGARLPALRRAVAPSRDHPERPLDDHRHG